MTQEDFKARVSMAYEGREQWDAFLDRVWLIHASELPRWISVEDELPEKNENVLVCGDGRVFYGCWLGGELWAIARQPLEERLDFEVTHWTALPAPPIVSKMENTEKKGGDQ